jgi:hypothetical protein
MRENFKSCSVRGLIAASVRKWLCALEAVPQLVLTTKKLLLLGFEAIFVLIFLAFLDCWTASLLNKTHRSIYI